MSQKIKTDLVVDGAINATSIIKSGGTSSQFLKADGSVDSSTYLTTETDTLNSVTTRGGTTANAITIGGLVVDGSLASAGTDYGYYQNAGTNIILKGDAQGRSGIFFQSEKNGTTINHPSDYGFIQFHSYGFNGTTGESNVLAIGVANDSTDTVVLQSPYNGGVKVGYKDATGGTGLTLQTIFHDAYHPNADTLTTARTINGTSFNGSANITTANWGTARTLTIGNTGKSVNGSANVSWSLAEIGALPLTGGTLSGALTTTSLTVDGANDGVFGYIAASWAGSANYPTLYSAAPDRWVMHVNPHISYTQNGVNGFTGSMLGATIRMAGQPAATTYWDMGVGVNSVGADTFSIGRSGTSFLSINNAGVISASISGNAATASTATDALRMFRSDNRTISPSELGAERMEFGFTSYGNNNTAPWADYLHLRSYKDATGGNDNLLMFRKDGSIGMRLWTQAWGSSTAYSTYKDVAFTDSNISGNAGSATILQTARTINGTSFNGSANITTANWGTARTINGVSVNGSTNYTIEPYVERDDTTNATRYLTFVDDATAAYKRLNMDNTLNYNPSTGFLTATSFVGGLVGNANTATTLATARTINGTSFNGSANITTSAWGTSRNLTIGAATKAWDGSANLSFTLVEIGAATGSASFPDLINKGLGTGSYITSGDFRAPIFYDSTDELYYLHPNGFSNLSSGRFNSNLEVLGTLTYGAFSTGTNGYTRLPNGFILQWGRYTQTGSSATYSFPSVFPSACLGLWATKGRTGTAATSQTTAAGVGLLSKAQFYLDSNDAGGTGYVTFILAIGY